MHSRRSIIALLMCLATSCAIAPTPARPPFAKPIPPPAAAASCAPLPEGLKLYGGIAFAEVEHLGKFPMQRPERRYLATSNHLWSEFREGLSPTDLIFEYVHDEKWEMGTIHHGGVTAFRNGCTVKAVQVWTT
jgi:hypothetical protein